MQAKFRWKFNFNNYSQKSQIYRWVHKFQTIESVNIHNNKTENLSNGGTARYSDNVDTLRDSVGRSLKKFLQRRSQELGLSRAL